MLQTEASRSCSFWPQAGPILQLSTYETSMTAHLAPLFVPGHSAKHRDKAIRSSFASFIVDLEDAVPLNEKESARRGAVAMCDALPGRCWVRVNPLSVRRSFGVECAAEDITAVVRPSLLGIVAPKIETAEDVMRIDAALAAAEKAASMETDGVELCLTIETALAIMNIQQIATIGLKRPMLLALGMGDLTTDLGISWTRDETESLFARALLPIAARAARLRRPMDSVFVDVQDMDGLRASAERGKDLGFDGKPAIHPSQISVIEDVYRPSQQSLDWAHRVVDTYAEKVASGEGAFLLDGKMIDEPIVVRARDLIARAASIQS